jgi:hypothetical protein
MNTTESRREFEEWLVDYYHESSTMKYDNGDYINVEAVVAWEAWKAAREQITEQRDRLVEAQNILKQCLSAMPVGYIPTHTAENLPEMIGDLAKALAEETAEREKFERELTAVTEQRDQWKDKYIQQNKDLGHELRDPNGTIWSECKRLQTELDVVTEQRDKEREIYQKSYSAELARSNHYKQQRDRLVEALKELLTTGDNGYGTPTDKAWKMAEQAIAAVEGGDA